MAKGDRVQVVIAAVDKVAAPIRKINRQIESMTAPVRKVQRAFRSLAREAHLDKVGRALKGIARVTSRIAFAGIGAVGGLGVAIQRLATKGDSLAKLTRRLQVSSAWFQENEFAAGRVGVSSETFRKSISKLNTSLGQLKAGKGPISDLLKVVDPKFASVLKRTKDTGKAFELVVAKIRSFKDPAKQAALSAAFFGEMAADMVNFANAGAAEIDNLRKRARELGIVMSERTLKASEMLTDRLTDLKAVGFGLWQQIGGALMPVVSELAKNVTDWAVANQALIRDKVVEYVKKLGEVIGQVYDWLVDTIPKVGEFFGGFGGLKTITSDFIELVRNLNRVASAIDSVRTKLPVSQLREGETEEDFERRVQAQVNSLRQYLGFGNGGQSILAPSMAGRGLGPVESQSPGAAGAARIHITFDPRLIARQQSNDLKGFALDYDRGLLLPSD